MPDKIPELNLPEIDGASQIYDLKVNNPIDTKNVGLAVDVLNILAVKFRDETLNYNFHKEIAKIHQDIFDSIQNPRTGYLLELVIYVNHDGHLNLPQGRIINPIGVGTEPLDAMANYLNMDRMVPGGTPSKNLISQSSFLWITKTDGKLSARSIPKSYYGKFIELANTEATRRKLLGNWIALNPVGDLKEIKIAEFWQEQEKQKLILIDDENVKKKIAKLTSDMKILQDKANELYIEFQVTQEKMVESQKTLSTLNAISTVAGLIKSGIELNQVMSSDDKSVINGSDDHLLSLEETTVLTNSKLTNLGIRNETLTTIVKEYLDNLGVLHTELSTTFNVEIETMPAVPTLDSNPLLLP